VLRYRLPWLLGGGVDDRRGLALGSLALSKTMTGIPIPLSLSVAGEAGDFFPRSTPRRRSSRARPCASRSRGTLGRLGSMTSRSPIERPFSLPPIFTGMSITCQVLPRRWNAGWRRCRPTILCRFRRPGNLLASTGSVASSRSEKVRFSPEGVGDRDPVCPPGSTGRRRPRRCAHRIRFLLDGG